MARINADAARRAREEQRKGDDPNVLEIGGLEFPLVTGAPAGFLVGLGRVQRGDLFGMEEALESIFVDPGDVAKALKAGLDVHDLEEIAQVVFGIPLGEALASGS